MKLKIFMTPPGWGWAGFVWGFVGIWFLINDRLKLLAYKIFDPVKTRELYKHNIQKT